MEATSLTPPVRPDRTFAIAAAVVALFGAAQLIAIGAYYAGKARDARQANQALVVTAQPAVATPAATAATTTAETSAPPATAAPTAAAAVAAASPSNDPVAIAENLLKEATLLREKGDTTNALARLQDASQRDPKNAKVLAEMAMIYESIQLFDRSNETWRKVREIGPSAGSLYELADMKLKVGAQPTAAPVAAAAAAGPGFAGVSPLDAGTNRGGVDGIPDGSTFGITEAAVTNNPDPDADTNLTLRVGVKVRPNTLVDHTKVKIQVYFYDTVDNNKVALTDADVSYEWLTPNHDWKGTNPETLAVSYVRLKNGAISSDAALSEAAAAVTPGKKGSSTKKPAADTSTRKYAGYQVRVYYNDQLQDVRAEPTKLLNLFAPPLTLPTQ